MAKLGEKQSGDEVVRIGGALVRAVAGELEALLRRTPDPGLYVVATPIGNLFDSSLRMLWIIEMADHVYCEDTRHTRNLLTRFGIKRRLRAYHDHSGEGTRAEVLALLSSGQSVALVSDAGTPLVSDPGVKLVRVALGDGHAVYAIPGPSAVLGALTVSGLATESFMFCGFPGAKEKARRDRLKRVAGVPATLVFFEAANRLASTLADMAAIFGDRPGVVAREITKLNEEIRRDSLGGLVAWAKGTVIKGEVTIVVGPAVEQRVDDAAVLDRLAEVLAEASVRDAVRQVADEMMVAKSRVYDLAVGLKRSGRSDGS